MVIHLVRVPQDVDVVNVRCKPAKLGERPAFCSVHVDSYDICTHTLVLCYWQLSLKLSHYPDDGCIRLPGSSVDKLFLAV